MPTAARSVVGGLWIAASGRRASAQALLKAGEDRPRRVEALGPAAEDRRVARLEAQRAGIRGDVGAGLVDDPDHPERHPHARDVESVRTLPARHLVADRIGERGDRLEALGHGLDALVVERQAIEQRGAQAA